jgi:hypothetical protein
VRGVYSFVHQGLYTRARTVAAFQKAFERGLERGLPMQYTTLGNATPRYTTPRYTTPRYTTPHHTTTHHTTPHHATPHHTTDTNSHIFECRKPGKNVGPEKCQAQIVTPYYSSPNRTPLAVTVANALAVTDAIFQTKTGGGES